MLYGYKCIIIIYYMIYIFRVFSDKLLKKHTTSLAELIKRDKNRPSVIMWSIANEPRSVRSRFVFQVSVVRLKNRIDYTPYTNDTLTVYPVPVKCSHIGLHRCKSIKYKSFHYKLNLLFLDNLTLCLRIVYVYE
jgi:hypothetical protein